MEKLAHSAPPPVPSARLHFVCLARMSFGIVSVNGIVVRAAPVAKWAVGRDLEDVIVYYFTRRNGLVIDTEYRYTPGGNPMNKEIAVKALVDQCIINNADSIDRYWLRYTDDDIITYDDWTLQIRYIITDMGNGEVKIHSLTFDSVNKMILSEGEAGIIDKEYEESKNADAFGICSFCLQPTDMCVCS